MKLHASSLEVRAVAPWVAAAMVWFGLVVPMRAQSGDRLGEQSQIRRDRARADRSLRETGMLRSRVAAVLNSSCRVSAEPSAVRQRVVAATAGLPLSSFTLAVGVGAEAGAAVEAEGPRPAVLELMRRLGDPGRGGFLRSVWLREKTGRWSVAATTGIITVTVAGMPGPSCAGGSDFALGAPVREPAALSPPRKPLPARPPPPTLKAPEAPASSPSPDSNPGPPFNLVALVRAEGRNRVSVRLGDEVRVLAVGDQINGWTCLSIDHDEGALFSSANGTRAMLKAPR